MKEKVLSPALQDYIEENIIPLYKEFDQAHQVDHAITVIHESLVLAQHYDVDINMVYTIAAFHDTGLKGGREHHHTLSAEIIRQDNFLKGVFNELQINIMAEAAEDHRASSNHPPRSIYGCIVAEADRLIDAHTIVRRAVEYGLSYYPKLDKQGHYKRFVAHMKEKYAEGGYMKLWIPESKNVIHLKEFREILRDEAMTKALFEREWYSLVYG